jgi:hypothetical protein
MCSSTCAGLRAEVSITGASSGLSRKVADGKEKVELEQFKPRPRRCSSARICLGQFVGTLVAKAR